MEMYICRDGARRRKRGEDLIDSPRDGQPVPDVPQGGHYKIFKNLEDIYVTKDMDGNIMAFEGEVSYQFCRAFEEMTGFSLPNGTGPVKVELSIRLVEEEK